MSILLGTLFAVVVVVVILFCVIVVHELGHFIAAKLSGIKVDEFAFGFGPRLAAIKGKETTYSFRAIPAGGYVKMAGVLGLPGETDAGPRNFRNARGWKKVVTLLAGIVSNFVFAGLLISIYLLTPTPALVEPHSAMARAGFSSQDTFVSVAGRRVDGSSTDSVSSALHAATLRSQGAPIPVVMAAPGGRDLSRDVIPELLITTGGPLPRGSPFVQDGEYVVTAIGGAAPGTGDPAVLFRGDPTVTAYLAGTSPSSAVTGRLGTVVDFSTSAAASKTTAAWRVGYEVAIPGESLPAALRDGFLFIPSYLGKTLSLLWGLITTNPGGLNGPNGLTGPVGIAVIGVQQAKAGWASFLEFLGIISVSVGLVNVLPIPFLDGGRFVLLLVEMGRRKRLKPEHEALITAMGLLLILMLATYITIGDIQRLPSLMKGT